MMNNGTMDDFVLPKLKVGIRNILLYILPTYIKDTPMQDLQNESLNSFLCQLEPYLFIHVTLSAPKNVVCLCFNCLRAYVN